MGRMALTDFNTPTRLDGLVERVPDIGVGNPSYPAVNWQHGEPDRRVYYFQNWRGYHTWNKQYAVLGYPNDNRAINPYGTAGDTVSVLVSRNPASPIEPSPIDIGSYIVNTGMVYTMPNYGG